MRGSNSSTFRYLSAYGLNPCESVARGGYEVGGPERGSDLWVFCCRLARGGNILPLAPRVSWVLVEEARN